MTGCQQIPTDNDETHLKLPEGSQAQNPPAVPVSLKSFFKTHLLCCLTASLLWVLAGLILAGSLAVASGLPGLGKAVQFFITVAFGGGILGALLHTAASTLLILPLLVAARLLGWNRRTSAGSVVLMHLLLAGAVLLIMYRL